MRQRREELEISIPTCFIADLFNHPYHFVANPFSAMEIAIAVNITVDIVII